MQIRVIFFSVQGLYLLQFILRHYSCSLSSLQWKSFYLHCSENFSYGHKRAICFQKKTCAELKLFCSKMVSSRVSLFPENDQKEFWGLWEAWALAGFEFALTQNKTIHTHSFFPSQKKDSKKLDLSSGETHLSCCPCSRRFMFLKVSCLFGAANPQGFYYLVCPLPAAQTNTLKPLLPALGSSGCGHTGLRETLRLFCAAGPMLPDPESPS